MSFTFWVLNPPWEKKACVIQDVLSLESPCIALVTEPGPFFQGTLSTHFLKVWFEASTTVCLHLWARYEIPGGRAEGCDSLLLWCYKVDVSLKTGISVRHRGGEEQMFAFHGCFHTVFLPGGKSLKNGT